MRSRPTAAGANRGSLRVPDTGSPTLSTEQVARLRDLLRSAESVELKVSVPDADRRSTVAALGIDPLDAEIRQVVFLDTPDLALYQRGVVVRVRRIQRKPGDMIVKLRPTVPEQLPPALRRWPEVGVEVDAMPGGFVCSGSMESERDDAELQEALAGRLALSRLFTERQRAFFAAHAPEGVQLDDLSVLGPINVLKVKFTPEELGRRFVAELWTYPDGSRVLELSTKCETGEAFEVAGETRAFLARSGVSISGEQQPKTRKALEIFASELRGGT
jgi:hypothetical protein